MNTAKYCSAILGDWVWFHGLVLLGDMSWKLDFGKESFRVQTMAARKYAETNSLQSQRPHPTRCTASKSANTDCFLTV
jgi:hypothetical protein